MRKKWENQTHITNLSKKLSCRLGLLDVNASIWSSSSSSFALEYYPFLKIIIPNGKMRFLNKHLFNILNTFIVGFFFFFGQNSSNHFLLL